MKKTISGVVLVAIVAVSSPSFALAVTTTTPTNQTVSSPAELSGLLVLLQTLMKQVEELQKQLSQMRGEIRDLSAGMREGMSSDDVRRVQELLASDPTLYPKGSVTGFFGPLTKEAVMAFQKRHDLPQTGEVDEKTKSLLEDYLKKRSDNKVSPGWIKGTELDKKMEDKKRVEDKKEDKKEVKKDEKREDKKYEDNVKKDSATIKGHSEGMIEAAANVIIDLEKALRNAKAGSVDASDIREAEKDLAEAKSELAEARAYYAKGEYQDAYDDAYEAKMSAYDGIEELK
jgi:peptidoglycan hydrolase-like protein with peptidoglycan-binding domain